jgi:hypothetical protein
MDCNTNKCRHRGLDRLKGMGYISRAELSKVKVKGLWEMRRSFSALNSFELLQIF